MATGSSCPTARALPTRSPPPARTRDGAASRSRGRRRGSASERVGWDESARRPEGRGRGGDSRWLGPPKPHPSRTRESGREAEHFAGMTGGGRDWDSRLIVGTGGFRSLDDLDRALEASGAQIVTVGAAARRSTRKGIGARRDRRPGCLRAAEHGRVHTARDAVRTARLAREAFETEWIKLEVIGDDRTLFPTPSSSSMPPRRWSPRGSRCFRTPTTTRFSRAGSRRSDARR